MFILNHQFDNATSFPLFFEKKAKIVEHCTYYCLDMEFLA